MLIIGSIKTHHPEMRKPYGTGYILACYQLLTLGFSLGPHDAMAMYVMLRTSLKFL